MVTEAEGEDDENKMVSAMGMLRTIVTFVRMMDESTEVCPFFSLRLFLLHHKPTLFISSKILRQLEICFLPMMQVVLEEAMLGLLFFTSLELCSAG